MAKIKGVYKRKDATGKTISWYWKLPALPGRPSSRGGYATARLAEGGRDEGPREERDDRRADAHLISHRALGFHAHHRIVLLGNVDGVEGATIRRVLEVGKKRPRDRGDAQLAILRAELLSLLGVETHHPEDYISKAVKAQRAKRDAD